jgi:hypothetical protein
MHAKQSTARTRAASHAHTAAGCATTGRYFQQKLLEICGQSVRNEVPRLVGCTETSNLRGGVLARPECSVLSSFQGAPVVALIFRLRLPLLALPNQINQSRS